MTIKTASYSSVFAICFTLIACKSDDKFGTYKLHNPQGISTITLYHDSTFSEDILSDTIDKRCIGKWESVNQRDSVIATITYSCESMILTMTPRRELKIDGDKLILIERKEGEEIQEMNRLLDLDEKPVAPN